MISSFNLDFEEADSTNKRPSGWKFYEYSNYTFSLDADDVYHGKYALRIEKTKNSPMPFGGFASILLEGIQPMQKVKLTGYLKTAHTTVDSIGLFISFQNTEEEKFETISDHNLAGSHPWQKFTIEMMIDSPPEILLVGAYLLGEGTVWVDDLRLFVDDQPVFKNPDRKPYEANEAEIAWLKDNSLPLRTVEAENGFDDLEPLKQLIGDARIVALGENTHGTSEVFKMKHRLVEYLSSEMGFTIFSIEANMPEAYRINEYVLHGKGDARKLLSGMYFWTWNTQEVLDMMEWMRKFNAEKKGTIQFTGFDMQFYPVAMENLVNFAEKYGDELKLEVDSLSLLMENVPFQKQYREVNKEELQTCLQKCNEIHSYLKQHLSNDAQVSQAEVNWALQNLRIIQQFLELKENASGDYTFRDKCMAENVSWILDSNPGSKIILWAHNGHIYYQKGAMGRFLSDQFGDDYYAIGFLSGSGTYTAVKKNGGVSNANVFVESKPGSFEYNFSRTGVPMFFFDFTGVDENEPHSLWLTTKMDYRSIGAMAMENQFYPTILSKKFDAIIYLDSTNASDCFSARNY